MISISNNDNDQWIVKNSIYNEFVTYICDQLGEDDEEIKDELMSSIFVNGIALDKIENKTFARKVSSLIEESALKLSKGDATLISMKSSEAGNNQELQKLFNDLYLILSGWE